MVIGKFNVYLDDEEWLFLDMKKAKEMVGNIVINNAIDGLNLDIAVQKEEGATKTDIIIKTYTSKEKRYLL